MGKIKAMYKKGDKVMVASDNDNDGYDGFRNKVLEVTAVSVSENDHPGFDSGLGQALYDLKEVKGKEIGCSLYEYELEDA